MAFGFPDDIRYAAMLPGELDIDKYGKRIFLKNLLPTASNLQQMITVLPSRNLSDTYSMLYSKVCLHSRQYLLTKQDLSLLRHERTSLCLDVCQTLSNTAPAIFIESLYAARVVSLGSE